MKVDVNQSHYWNTRYEKDAEIKINLTHSTGYLFTYEEILNLNAGIESFVSKIKNEKISYGPFCGSEGLRQKIGSIYKNIPWESIIITNGCSNANFLAFYTFLEPGDEVIIVTPNWWPILVTPESFGAKIRFLQTKEEDKFIPQTDGLISLITNKTKMIVMTNPSNPSGSIMNLSNLKEVISLAEKHDIWVLCDEVYKGIENNNTDRIPSVTEIYEKGLTTSSVSKVFGIPGARVGWIMSSDAAAKEMISRWDYVVVDCGFLDQFLASIAMDNYSYIMGLQRDLAIKNRKMIIDWVNKESLIDCPVYPVAGTTAFLKFKGGIDTRDIIFKLIKETGTYVVPGFVYDKTGRFNNYIRIGYMIDSDHLKMGLENLSSFIHNYT